jgi:hypothetical protein
MCAAAGLNVVRAHCSITSVVTCECEPGGPPTRTAAAVDAADVAGPSRLPANVVPPPAEVCMGGCWPRTWMGGGGMCKVVSCVNKAAEIQYACKEAEVCMGGGCPRTWMAQPATTVTLVQLPRAGVRGRNPH